MDKSKSADSYNDGYDDGYEAAITRGEPTTLEGARIWNAWTAVMMLLIAARETVVCSAIRMPNGKVFRGHRHGDCLQTAKAFVDWNGGIDPGDHHWGALDFPGRDQGFITSRNRYVGREEGLRLQLAAGIPSACPSGYRVRELFSEDLY